MTTDYIKQAVTGTQDYHSVLRQAAVAGLQRQAGYVAQSVNTSNDLFQYTLDGSVVLIETDIEAPLQAWYRCVDNIIEMLKEDPEDEYGFFIDKNDEYKRLSKHRVFLETILNRANIHQTPDFWEYVFARVDVQYLPDVGTIELPEYPQTWEQMDALCEQYRVEYVFRDDRSA